MNLGSLLQENYTSTDQYTEKLQSTTAGAPGYQIQATSFGVAESVSLNGTVFNLSNIHFHDPTEDLVNGAAPGVMEEHLVDVSAAGGETVLAVFIQLGTAANPTLDKLFGALASLGTAGGSTLPGSTVGVLNFADLLPTNLQGWFYPGSLTTPPLATPVNWFVFATPIEMNQQELNEYETYAKAAGFFPNARPVQSLAGRTFNDLTAVTLGTTDVTANIINAAAVPAPSSVVLMGTASLVLLGLGLRGRWLAA